MIVLDLRATPTDTLCPECEGSGQTDEVLDEPWPGLNPDDCVWCHGTGRVLQPISAASLKALRKV